MLTNLSLIIIIIILTYTHNGYSVLTLYSLAAYIYFISCVVIVLKDLQINSLSLCFFRLTLSFISCDATTSTRPLFLFPCSIEESFIYHMVTDGESVPRYSVIPYSSPFFLSLSIFPFRFSTFKHYLPSRGSHLAYARFLYRTRVPSYGGVLLIAQSKRSTHLLVKLSSCISVCLNLQHTRVHFKGHEK